MQVEKILAAIATIQKPIQGIKRAHDKAPDALNELPAFVSFLDSGEIGQRRGNIRDVTHKIQMNLFVAKGDSPSAEAVLRPLLNLVVEKFDQNLTLKGTCVSSGITNYKYGVLTYAGVDYLGISFTLQAMERETVIYQA